MKYVGFLRGINAGGHVTVKMETLVDIFVQLGFKNVNTYNHNGNVIFESEEENIILLEKKIEKAFLKYFGYPIILIIKKIEELQSWVKMKFFRLFNNEDKVKRYVTLFWTENQTPMTIRKNGVDYIAELPGAVFSISKIIDGKHISPNDFIERQYGIPATTRDWKTILEIVKNFR